MKLNVDELNSLAHDFSEESFEQFDDIYDACIYKELEVKEDDIIKLCHIFCTPFREIHPHQYIKIHKITYYVIEKVGANKGIYLLIQGLLRIPQMHAVDYLRMLKGDEEYLKIFRENLTKFNEEEQQHIIQCLQEAGVE